jgi:PAS domain S-box-containing protein
MNEIPSGNPYDQGSHELKIITDAIDTHLLHLDSQTRILFVNRATENFWQLTKEQMIGRTIKEIIGEEAYEGIRSYTERVLKGETVSYESSFVDPQGQTSYYLNVYTPDFAEDGRVQGFVVTGTDITARRKAEESLQKALLHANAANASKSAFLANMSHEIRTPLGAIMGFTELLQDPRTPWSDKIGFIEIVSRNTKVLSDLVDDILDLSKVEAGRLLIRKESVDLHLLITEIITLLQQHAHAKGIALELVLHPDLPHTIETDSLRLRQILLNILGNAIKFTDQGRVTLKVALNETLDQKQILEFLISDTGIGIHAKYLNELFRPFSQEDHQTTRRFGGTGLGLALSRKLAELLGGDILLLQSEPGHGSTFSVVIDPGTTQEAGASTAAPLNEKARVGDARPGLEGCRILVAEDNPDNQILIKRILTKEGALVEVVGNGRAAIEKVALQSFDIILMDIQMPVMDGIEAITILRQKGYTKPVVALTAHALKEEQDRCLKAGFDDHVSKPIHFQSLTDKLMALRTGESGLAR